jgi:hypothetical protein
VAPGQARVMLVPARAIMRAGLPAATGEDDLIMLLARTSLLRLEETSLVCRLESKSGRKGEKTFYNRTYTVVTVSDWARVTRARFLAEQ